MKKIFLSKELRGMLSLVSFVLFILSGLACQKENEQWAGTILKENGLTVVKNPIEPYFSKEILKLEEDLTIGTKEGEPEYLFQRIRTLEVNDNDNIFVLDTQASQVKVYDGQGKFLRSFGRPGQGPGELQFPMTILLNPKGEVIVGQLNKISYFTSEGEFIKSIPQNFQGFVEDVDDEGNLLATVIDIEKQVYEIRKFDPGLNYLFTVGQSPLPSAERRRTGETRAFFPLIRFAIINSNQIVCGYPGEGYFLKIYDFTGKLIKRIEKEYLPIEVTEEMKKEIKLEYPENMRDSLVFPEELPPYIRFSTDDQGRIYVSTYETDVERKGFYHDVFDAEGRFITRFSLKSRPLVIKKNFLYTIEEDEEGYQFVKRYRMGWRTPT